jgi:hypothetical protein
MFKRKWVIFNETANFRVYMPLRLFKKIERRAKKGLSTIIPRPEDLRIEIKDPEMVGRILEEFLQKGGTIDVEPHTETEHN